MDPLTHFTNSICPLSDNKSFINLPEEILFKIFSFLSVKELAYVGMTNSKCKRISEDNHLWQPFIQIIDSDCEKEFTKALFINKINLIYQKINENLSFKSCLKLVRLNLFDINEALDFIKKILIDRELKYGPIFYLELGEIFITMKEYDKAESLLPMLKITPPYKQALVINLLNHYISNNLLLKALNTLQYLIKVKDVYHFSIISFFFIKVFSSNDYYELALIALRGYPSLSYYNKIFAKVFIEILMQDEENEKNKTMIIELRNLFPHLDQFNDKEEAFFCLFYCLNNQIDLVLEKITLIKNIKTKKFALTESIKILLNLNNYEAATTLNLMLYNIDPTQRPLLIHEELIKI